MSGVQYIVEVKDDKSSTTLGGAKCNGQRWDDVADKTVTVPGTAGTLTVLAAWAQTDQQVRGLLLERTHAGTKSYSPTL